jgi:hypothetical protein
MTETEHLATRFMQLYAHKEDLKDRNRPIDKEYKDVKTKLMEVLHTRQNKMISNDKYNISIKTRIKKPPRNDKIIGDAYTLFQKAGGRDVTIDERDAFIGAIDTLRETKKGPVEELSVEQGGVV